jgi:hypothetical protein
MDCFSRRFRFLTSIIVLSFLRCFRFSTSIIVLGFLLFLTAFRLLLLPSSSQARSKPGLGILGRPWSLRHDNMVTTIRGRLPNRTAKEAVYPTTTDASSGIRHWIMKTVITQALTGNSDQEIETWATEVQEAIVTVEVTEARETERATAKRAIRARKPSTNPKRQGGGMNRQQRLLEITEKIAVVPTQNITPYEHRFKNMTHPVLLIRSLRENCSQVNQFRGWVNDSPPMM